jgi:hypothetical protein
MCPCIAPNNKKQAEPTEGSACKSFESCFSACARALRAALYLGTRTPGARHSALCCSAKNFSVLLPESFGRAGFCPARLAPSAPASMRVSPEYDPCPVRRLRLPGRNCEVLNTSFRTSLPAAALHAFCAAPPVAYPHTSCMHLVYDSKTLPHLCADCNHFFINLYVVSFCLWQRHRHFAPHFTGCRSFTYTLYASRIR